MTIDIRTIMELLTLIGLGVAGIFAIVGAFDQRRKEYTKESGDLLKESDTLEEGLRRLLREQNEELGKKIKAQQAQIQSQSTQIFQLQTQVTELDTKNKFVVEILQGRDQNTQKINEVIMKASEVATQAGALAKENNEILKRQNANIEGLTQVIHELVAKMADR